MSIKYRDHKGSLDESMETVQEINCVQQLKKHLQDKWKRDIEEIRFNYACHDPRIDWQTYYVLVKFKGEQRFIISGMSDGDNIPDFAINYEYSLS